MNSEPSFDCANAHQSDIHRTEQGRWHSPLLRLIGVLAISLFILTALTDFWSTGTYAAPVGQTVPPPGTVPSPVPTTPGTIPPFTIIYLGFKTSDEIEFDDDEQEDFVYKNEDIVAFVPGTAPGTGTFSIFFDGSACGLADANLDDFEVLADGTILFTLRAAFDLPGLGRVDDSDVIQYTPAEGSCGTFAFRLKGTDVGLTQGAEDIDGLGIDAEGNLLISTIGTAKVPGSTGEIEAKDQDLLKLNEISRTWSIYFDGSDVGLTESSEDVRSVAIATGGTPQENSNIYLTISGDFDVESNNEDEGDKNDVEACTPISLAEETTECFFFKFLDGETVNAENQLDGLSIVFGATQLVTSAVNGSSDADSTETGEASIEAADIAELLAEGDSEVTADDLFEADSRIYLPLVQQ